MGTCATWTSCSTPSMGRRPWRPRWERDPDLFERVYPMDLRPQAHEIIRTWLFSSVVRAHLEFDGLPWSDAAISGWILDPDRKKMSSVAIARIPPTRILLRTNCKAS